MLYAKYRQETELERLQQLAINNLLPSRIVGFSNETNSPVKTASGSSMEDGRRRSSRVSQKNSRSTTINQSMHHTLRSREKLQMAKVRLQDLEAPLLVADQIGLNVTEGSVPKADDLLKMVVGSMSGSKS